MKILFSACTLLFSLWGTASATVNYNLQKLQEVNSYWASQKDIDLQAVAALKPANEHAWIQAHLQLAEQTLRNRSTAHLSAKQISNRTNALDQLHGYWIKGAFPINTAYSYRTPIFIDAHDNFCAVGFMVKATGYEQVSRQIAAANNLVYVRDIQSAGLQKWAQEYGFTTEELAWIQPGYPPQTTVVKVGGGTNGEIYALHADAANGILYAGGAFTKADSTISAGNIAAITENNGTYTWQALGAGLNGPVHAVTVFDNKVWAGGSFTTAGGSTAEYIAYWNGSTWKAAGTLMGTVKDLIVYKNELYAINDCNSCFTAASFLMKWNGTAWSQIHSENGNFNKLFVYEDNLLIGGKFNAGKSCDQNILQYDGDTVLPAGDCAGNEVYTFAVYKDTLLTGVKFYEKGDSSAVKFLDGNTWRTYIKASPYEGIGMAGESVNTLLAKNNVLCMGGKFYSAGLSLTWVHNFLANDTKANADENLGDFDGGVNCLTLFNNKLFIAGAFSTTAFSNPVNHICAKTTLPGLEDATGLEDVQHATITVAPNPVLHNGTFSLQTSAAISKVQLWNITGVLAKEWKEANNSYSISGISQGAYIVRATTANGAVSVSKIIIR